LKDSGGLFCMPSQGVKNHKLSSIEGKQSSVLHRKTSESQPKN